MQHQLRPSEQPLTQATRLPSRFKSRAGWVEYFDLKRLQEPHLHQIEPTNSCPYSCVMCPRRKMTRKVGFMDSALFTKVIDEAARFKEPVHSKEIELFHFGESLLHPEIAGMVGYASALDLKTTLSVNAPQLSPDLAMRILSSRPYKLIISLDGYDDASYQSIRGGRADYARATANIENLVEIQKGQQSKTLIRVRMIVLKSNEGHAQDFKRHWEEKGVTVELRGFFPWGDKEMVEIGAFEKYPPGMPCPFPWQHLVVQWNGDVVPCCRDYNSTIRLGNVSEQSLVEIWNSERYERFREQHRTGRYDDNPTCAECMSIYYTAGLGE